MTEEERRILAAHPFQILFAPNESADQNHTQWEFMVWPHPTPAPRHDLPHVVAAIGLAWGLGRGLRIAFKHPEACDAMERDLARMGYTGRREVRQ